MVRHEVPVGETDRPQPFGGHAIDDVNLDLLLVFDGEGLDFTLLVQDVSASVEMAGCR